MNSGLVPPAIPWYMPDFHRLERGPSDWDHRHIVSISYLWNIPTVDASNGLARAVLGNWETTGIVSGQSGGPFTVFAGRDISKTNLNVDRANVTGDPYGGDACAGVGAACKNWLNPHPSRCRPREPAIAVESETTLDATPTGQVSTSVAGETVPEMTREAAEKLASDRPRLDPKQLRPAIAQRLGLALESIQSDQISPVAHLGSVQHEGYSIETVTLETEPGISVPALVFIPSTGPRRKPAILYANAAGKSADAGPGGAIEALVHAGNIVLAPDLRGWGESASLGGRPPHTGRYETTMRAFIVGKTMVGMQVLDLLRTFNYLASRPDVNPEKIALLGKGNGGVVALFAAALDPRLNNTICEDALVSYLDLASTTYYDQSLFDLIGPGVLKDFDLPDVAAAIAPRSLQIIDPQSASEALEPVAEVRREYATTERTYQAQHRVNLFRISSRPLEGAR